MERALIGLLLGLSLTVVYPARAAATASVHTFVLVIANNRSTTNALPDLQYADDDGARYYRLFRSLAHEPDIELLTSFDRASARTYGALGERARPPNQRELLAARDRLLHAIVRARTAGEKTVLYVLYAGHGEMLDGRGLLDLEDTQIDGAFVERELLDPLPADAKHVVLDSCNSFFVMNPRKPGGKRWATPKDMAFGFSARHPEVGLFLSTNSESEVYEWSELESGVFSHEVRSGLSGGADADHDGIVSYLELAGFIDRANRGIARETLRPQLFFRGPGGDARASLFPVASMRGRRVVLGAGEQRLWIKTETGERLLDLHKEAVPVTLVVPEGERGPLTVYEQHKTAEQRLAVREQTIPTGDDTVQLVSLPEGTPPILAARGNALFGSLFSEAFGPAALAAYTRETQSEPEPVFGLTSADLTRMHNYLGSLSELGRTRRVFAGAGYLAAAAITGSITTALAVQPDRRDSLDTIACTAALSAISLGMGLKLTLQQSSGERALRVFEGELSRHKQGARAFVETDRLLAEMVERERRTRLTIAIAYQVAAGIALAGAVATVLDDAHGEREHRARALDAAVLFSEAAVFATVGVLARVFETPTERTLNLYRKDPGLQLRLGASASSHAVQLGLNGAF